MAPESSIPAHATADTWGIVLGGGGATGNAWLIGVLAGLRDGGLDAADADLLVGTSAGATAAAQAASGDLAALYAAALETPPAAPAPGPRAASLRADGAPDAPRAAPPVDHLTRTQRIIDAAEDAPHMRRLLGAAALDFPDARSNAWTERWRSIVGGRLPTSRWPEIPLRITALDAETGEGTVFDREAGVPLVDAVAASCSSGLPYRIGDRWFLDGGYRRNENADLARGMERVLVLSPFGGRTRHPLAWNMQLSAQVEELRAAGAEVQVIVPDPRTQPLIGAGAMDLSKRSETARAGHRTGLQHAG
ncbi:patatin-like phospholipase family protein [Brachybacterium kimchii]|uniref:Patatin-like phospholipase family protein n=1 Tax=Brachybacterium kimchii TaxID=2942909 RepID=A0ABY4N903_9MICO|nr:patatin-like phospholipase family protein [Brachybacterium kimchii]UQN30281.1 patatin-like phospholipase family protein [Brachybacterium kimchii]